MPNEKVHLYHIDIHGDIIHYCGVIKSDFKNLKSARFEYLDRNHKNFLKCSKDEGTVLHNNVWYRQENSVAALHTFLKHEEKEIKRIRSTLSVHILKFNHLNKERNEISNM